MLLYDCFWGKDDGIKYRRFDQSKIDIQTMQYIRMVFIHILSVFLFAGFFFEAGPFKQYLYLQVWTAYLSFASLILNYIATEQQLLYPDRVYGKKLIIWHCALIILEISLPLNITASFGYWVFNDLGNYKKKQLIYWYKVGFHILPFIFGYLDLKLNKFLFRSFHYIVLFCVGVVYTVLNKAWTEITGEPVYLLLNWKDIGVIQMFVGGSFIIFTISYFTIWCKSLRYNKSETDLKDNNQDLEYSKIIISNN